MITHAAPPTAQEWPPLPPMQTITSKRPRRASDETAHLRLAICRACPKVQLAAGWHLCPPCECASPMEFKAFVAAAKCPLGRWEALTDGTSL